MVFREIWRQGSAERALWNLWLDGFSVDERRVRSFLTERVRRLIGYREALLAAGEGNPGEPKDIVDEIGAWARARLTNKALARSRRAIGIERFAYLSHFLAWFGLGLFDGWAHDDPIVLADTFQLRSAVCESELIRISKALDPSRLCHALESASKERLNEAKIHLRSFVDFLWFWLTPDRIWNVEQRIGKRGAELLALVVKDPGFRTQVLPFLFVVAVALWRTADYEAFRRILIGKFSMEGWPLPIP
jgi:hypothetical protein